MNRLLAASIVLGCLLITAGILLRGQGPSAAQYEELRIRLHSLELRAKAEDSGFLNRVESDATAKAYAQVAYEGVKSRMEDLELTAVSGETFQKVIDAANDNFAQDNERHKDVIAKLRTLFDLISKQSARVDAHEKNIKSLNDYIKNLVKQLNENRR